MAAHRWELDVGTAKIISVHSYRGGTGKSNITANLAACAVAMGHKVAVIDTDLKSPGIHVLFGVDPSQIQLTLVDYLWDKCTSTETAYDVTTRVCPNHDHAHAKCWLVPASLDTHAISRLLDEGYDIQRLNTHIDDLISQLELDYLLIDTHPGLNDESMLTTALSDILILLVRPDQQDYYGSAVVSRIATQLEVPNIFVVANKLHSQIDVEQITQHLKQAFGHDVLGAIPLSEDLAKLGSRQLIVNESPEGIVAHTLKIIAKRIFAT